MDKYLVIKSVSETVWAFKFKEAVAIGATIFIAKETYEWLNAFAQVANTKIDEACQKILDVLENKEQ